MINLFERNFDTEPDSGPQSEPDAEGQAEAALHERLIAARQEGFDAGRKVGRQDSEIARDNEQAEQAAAVRASIAEQLAALGKMDKAARLQSERDIVDLFAGIAERLVPELLESYGIDLAIARIHQALEKARTDPVLSIRACPDVIGVLKCEAPEWLSPQGTNTQIDLRADAKMNRGAVRVQWEGGRLDYDLHAACVEMLQALADAAEAYENSSEKAG